MYRYHPENIGEFVEVDHGKCFTYRKTENAWAISQGLYHEVDVINTTLFAKVKKTVVYVAIDEDAEGKAVLEKWNIKAHIVFSKD